MYTHLTCWHFNISTIYFWNTFNTHSDASSSSLFVALKNIKIDTFSRTPRSKRDADTNKGGVDTELGSGDDDYEYYDDDDEYVFVHSMYNSPRLIWKFSLFLHAFVDRNEIMENCSACAAPYCLK